MSESSLGWSVRLRNHLLELDHDSAGQDWTAFKREIEDAVDYIEQIESRLKRRDDTIRELRRTVMLELLSLQTSDCSEVNRIVIQKNTVERLRHDEILLAEWRRKAGKLEEELKRVQTINSTIRMNGEADKKHFHRIRDELEFNKRELMEQIKTVNADMKYLNIVMIGKDAIIEKQYSQLQERDAQIESLYAQQVTYEAGKVESTKIIESLRKENEELQLNKENAYLLERLDLVKQDNITLKKSLADYKAGYNNLAEKCKILTESLHSKHDRRKSKSIISVIPENIEEKCDKPSHKSDAIDVHPPVTAISNRRKSSRMSIVRKKSFALKSGTPMTDSTAVATAITANLSSDANKNGVNENSSSMTEEKECQVNINSSQYANVRMGNEEEVVVKALYKRVAELEDIVLARQKTIDDMLLEMNDQALQVKRKKVSPSSLSGTDADLSEYQTQSYEEFLSSKSDEKVQQKLIVDLENKIKVIRDEYLAKQTPEPAMESKAMQCETLDFVTNASVQAVAETKEFSTQTLRHTPISNHQSIEDPFYSYIFKELLDVCKHVVTTHLTVGLSHPHESQDEVQDSTTTDVKKTNSIFCGCKNLISSLNVLRKDLFEEMKYRGGDFNTLRSRSFLRCIEVVIRAFDKILNDTEKESKTIVKQEFKCDNPATDNVDSAFNGMMMSPITLHMTQFKHDNIPIYEYDYDVNKVLFSTIEAPACLPAPDHFGGGAPKGTLVRPSHLSSTYKDKSSVMKHCATKDMDFLSDTNWVIPRVGSSFCDSFVESSASVRVAACSSPRQPRVDVVIKNGSCGNNNNTLPDSMTVSPAKLCSHVPANIPGKRVVHPKTIDRAEYVEEFFAISRPLSPQKDKSSISPRHVVFIEKTYR